MKTMRMILLLLMATLMTTVADARKKDDPDMRRVRLTMTDGSKLEGYIPSKYMFWAIQYRIPLADNPEGKKSKKYDAKKIAKMEWLTPTEEHPEGEVWEHCQTIYNYMLGPTTEDCLLELLYRGKNASVYRVHIYIGGTAVYESSWATWYAVKPHDDERAFLIYNATLDKLGGMDYQFKKKENYAGWKDFLQTWWKKDKTIARKQVNDSPAILSKLYDEWLATSRK